MLVASDLNPEALRRPQSKNKVCSDREFVETVLREGGKAHGTIIRDAARDLEMSRATAAR
jgi:general stress protein YciG